MFDKLKQLKELRELQNAAQQERFESEKSGVKVVVNGTLQVESVVLNGEMPADQQAGAVKDAVNEALKKAQFSMAKKFQGMM